MTTHDESSQKTPAFVWVLLTALVGWGLFPYRGIVHHYAWKVDGIKWVTQAATDQPGWARWVFASHHFVGYRPVAAGSFSLDYAIAGYSPEVYRITDFGLHAGAAIAIAHLFRRLTGNPRAWMLLPVLLFLGHPAVEEVLPYLARRSYLLAVLFGTAGLSVWLDGLRRPGVVNPHLVGATLLFTLAMLSNEVAFVLLPMLVAFTLHETWGEEPPLRALRRCVLPWLPAVPAVAARWATLGWSGGYVKHYFVFTRGGRKTLTQVQSFNFDHIVGAAFDYTWLPVSFRGADAFVLGGALGVFAIATFYAWATVIEPLLGLRDKSRRMPLLLGIWMLGYALLFGLSKTWFWRQGYPMVVPLSLLVSWIALDTVNRFWGRWWVLAMRAVPQIVLGIALLSHSPLFVGMSTGSLHGRFSGNRILAEIVPHLTDLEAPAQVYTVLPLPPTAVHNTHQWLKRIYGKQRMNFVSVAQGTPRRGLVRIEGERLLFGPQANIQKGYSRRVLPGKALTFRALRSTGRVPYLLSPDGGRSWSVVRLDESEPPPGRRRRP